MGRRSKKPRVVVGIVCNAQVVMLPEQQAATLLQLQDALGAETWGEFKKLAPKTWYESALERFHDQECEAPNRNTPFNPEQIYGYTDGDWPAWPQQQMLAWVPEEIQTEFGRAEASTLNGPFLDIGAEDIDRVIAAMEALGYQCRRDDASVERACGA